MLPFRGAQRCAPFFSRHACRPLPDDRFRGARVRRRAIGAAQLPAGARADHRLARLVRRRAAVHQRRGVFPHVGPEPRLGFLRPSADDRLVARGPGRRLPSPLRAAPARIARAAAGGRGGLAAAAPARRSARLVRRHAAAAGAAERLERRDHHRHSADAVRRTDGGALPARAREWPHGRLPAGGPRAGRGAAVEVLRGIAGDRDFPRHDPKARSPLAGRPRADRRWLAARRRDPDRLERAALLAERDVQPGQPPRRRRPVVAHAAAVPAHRGLRPHSGDRMAPAHRADRRRGGAGGARGTGLVALARAGAAGDLRGPVAGEDDRAALACDVRAAGGALVRAGVGRARAPARSQPPA